MNLYDLTPIERINNIYVKRDDLFEIAGQKGGKVRTCFYLAQGARGLITAGSRMSPQVKIVANIAKHLNIPCRVHTPQGALTPELTSALDAGAKLFQHRAGYNNVIIARARQDAKETGYKEIPFGMQCKEAVDMTSRQVVRFPKGVRRIVVPVGSGMSLAGILHGLQAESLFIPVIGIVVGADPEKRLNTFAPLFWSLKTQLINAGVDYHKRVDASIGDLKLDPIYEAKCKKFLQPNDLFWIIGNRE